MRSFIAALLVLAACSPAGAGSSNGSASGGSAADAPAGAPAQTFEQRVRDTYGRAYDACSHDPEGAYGAAGSRSIHNAAEWYSIGTRKGAHRDAAYRGCADALRGNDRSF